MVQIKLQTNVLSSHKLLDRRNRNEFQEEGVLVINMMSFPGAGIITILERTMENISQQLKKYPLIFRESGAVLLNKVDLLPFTDFSIDKFHQDLLKINPRVEIFPISSRTGQGVEEWSAWLAEEVKKKPFPSS